MSDVGHNPDCDAGLAEARKIIDDTFAFANRKRESGRSSMPITLDDVYALVALASLGVDCVGRVEQWSRAADLHAPTRAYPEFRFAPWCDECSQGYTAGGDDPPSQRRVSWPCNTARALGLVDPLAPKATCDGSSKCPATVHVHGCFADLDGSACDDPGDHQTCPTSPAETSGGASE